MLRVPFAPQWTPKRIANGALWLRADLGITLGTGVSAWADQLGIQPAAVQATALSQPTISAAAVNGHPALTVNGAQFLQLASFVPPSTDAEMWIVLKCGSGSMAMLDVGATGAPAGAYPFGGTDFDRFMSTTRQSFSPIITQTAWHLYSVKSAASLWRAWQNGTQAFTTGTNTLGSGSTMGIFCRSDGTLLGTTGASIAELWIGRIMSSADRSRVRAYITVRYGLSLGSDWT